MAPEAASSLVASIDWVRAALLGSAATTVAVIAVGAVGALAFSGRLPARRGANVVLGCFVLFGAPIIAAGLISMRDEAGDAPPMPVVVPLSGEQPPIRQPAYTAPALPPRAPDDPYAGAAVR